MAQDTDSTDMRPGFLSEVQGGIRDLAAVLAGLPEYQRNVLLGVFQGVAQKITEQDSDVARSTPAELERSLYREYLLCMAQRSSLLDEIDRSGLLDDFSPRRKPLKPLVALDGGKSPLEPRVRPVPRLTVVRGGPAAAH